MLENLHICLIHSVIQNIIIGVIQYLVCLLPDIACWLKGVDTSAWFSLRSMLWKNKLYSSS